MQADALLLVLKVTLLLGAALVASRVLGRMRATRHHLLWSGAFAAVMFMPVLAAVLPELRVPVPVAVRGAVAAPPSVTETGLARRSSAEPAELGAVVRDARAERPAIADAPQASAPPLGRWAAMIWLAGCMVALCALAASHWRVMRLRRSAHELHDPAWTAACARIGARLGVMRPARIVETDAISTPMAGGLVRPVIFVPRGAASWSADRRDAVLAHELAHLAHRDPLRQLLVHVAFSLYWFHPLAWLAARRARTACEHACDEVVLSIGVRPSAYAQVLLDFAQVASAPRAYASRAYAALPMVRGTLLETRLVSILNHTAHSSLRGRAVIPVLSAIALTVVLAAAAPVRVAPAEAAAVVTATPVVAPPSASVAVPVDAPIAASSVAQQSAPACWADRYRDGSFSGSSSTSSRDGETVVYQMIGWRGNERVVQKQYGDLRVCGIAEGMPRDGDEPPREWLGRAAYMLIETRRGTEVRRMEISGNRVTYTVNGDSRDVNAAAREWRDDVIALMDASWELSRLHGRASSLRGQISSIHGQRSSLQGRISSLQGQVSSMRGQISSMQGQASSLRGEISSIQGHVSSLQGQISSEQGAISSLRSSRYDREGRDRERVDDRIREREARIRDIEREIDRYDAPRRIREVERRLSDLDNSSRIEATERRIRDFDLDGQIREIEREISRLDVEGRVREIEREIEALDVPRRSRELEAREEAALRRVLR